MLDAHSNTDFIERMLAAGLLVLGSLASRRSGVLDILVNLWRGTGRRVDACAHAVERSDNRLRWMGVRRKTGDQFVKHDQGAEKDHAATKEMIARN